ncbi:MULTISPECIES: hypothetical protein [Serratia]|uniref:hypothetical protein n=1 Tax=Serratia TaxID=613 RepID=UPI00157DE31F|nr:MULTISPECIES: hypothetical protein [Serratia]MBP1128886.1 hypothetical protein [Serratia sp. PL17]
MSFYKIEKKTAIQAWDFECLKRKELNEKANEFAAKFGATAVFTTDATRHRFYAVAFPDGVPTFGHPSLWTAATAANRYTTTPKRKAPTGLSKEHRELWALWDEGYPSEAVSREFLWSSLGLDWGVLFICGLSIFRFKNTIYFNTSAKPNLEFGAIEITGTEYSTAAEDFKNGK